MTGGPVIFFPYRARVAERNRRTTSVTIAITSTTAIAANCQTGAQSEIFSPPAVHERTYSMMKSPCPIYRPRFL